MSKHPVLTHVTRKRNPMIYNPHDPNKDTKGRKYLFDPYARVFNEATLQSTVSGGASSSTSHGLHVPSHVVHHTADQQNSPMMAEKIIRHIANPVRDQPTGVVDFTPLDLAENRIDPVSKRTYQDNEVSHNLAGHVKSGNIGAVHVEPMTKSAGKYPDPNPFGSNLGNEIPAPPTYGNWTIQDPNPTQKPKLIPVERTGYSTKQPSAVLGKEAAADTWAESGKKCANLTQTEDVKMLLEKAIKK